MSKATPSRGFYPYPNGGWFRHCGYCGKTTEVVSDSYMHVCKECGK